MFKSYNKQISPASSDPAIVKEIGQSLKQLRLSKNMSQQHLADISGLDRTTISRLEAGRAATLLTLVQILRAMNELYLLNTFIHEPEMSPIQLMKIQESQPKYATSKRKPRKNPIIDP